MSTTEAIVPVLLQNDSTLCSPSIGRGSLPIEEHDMTGRLARRMGYALVAAVVATMSMTSGASASTPATDVRLTNDSPATSGYVSDYTLATGTPYTDATLTEC